MTLSPLTVQRLVSPIDWSTTTDGPSIGWCTRCWSDFARDAITSRQLLDSILHPLRVYDEWRCPVCGDTVQREEQPDA